ncbi:MAG: hypothetical protein ABI655_14225 [Phenylobacterium sp.]
MTHGFQQQDPAINFSPPRSAATPQHGQKADKQAAARIKPPRSFEPRPGH